MMGKLVPTISSCYDSERLSCVTTELQLSVPSLLLQTRTSLFLFFGKNSQFASQASSGWSLGDFFSAVNRHYLADVVMNVRSVFCMGGLKDKQG